MSQKVVDELACELKGKSPDEIEVIRNALKEYSHTMILNSPYPIIKSQDGGAGGQVTINGKSATYKITLDKIIIRKTPITLKTVLKT